MPNSSTEQQASHTTYYPAVYSPPMENGNGIEDRSATPTPAEHTHAVEDSVDA